MDNFYKISIGIIIAIGVLHEILIVHFLHSIEKKLEVEAHDSQQIKVRLTNIKRKLIKLMESVSNSIWVDY